MYLVDKDVREQAEWYWDRLNVKKQGGTLMIDSDIGVAAGSLLKRRYWEDNILITEECYACQIDVPGYKDQWIRLIGKRTDSQGIFSIPWELLTTWDNMLAHHTSVFPPTAAIGSAWPTIQKGQRILLSEKKVYALKLGAGIIGTFDRV